MKRTLIGSLASFVVASAIVAAQTPTQNPPSATPPTQTPTAQTPTTQPPTRTQPPAATMPSTQQRGDQDVTLTGCLIQGTGPTVFVLDNAKSASQSSAEKGKSFVLQSSGEDMDFMKNLNHKVTVTGSADNKTVPAPEAGQKADEKDLPRLKAKTVISIADSCTADAR